jgi:hypothetical protein
MSVLNIVAFSVMAVAMLYAGLQYLKTVEDEEDEEDEDYYA